MSLNEDLILQHAREMWSMKNALSERRWNEASNISQKTRIMGRLCFDCHSG